GGHDDRTQHGTEAPAGMEPVHVAQGEVVRGGVVESGVDRTRPEPMEERTCREDRPHRRRRIAEGTEGDETATRGEEKSDAHRSDRAPRQHAGEEVAEPGAEKDQRDRTLGYAEVLPHRGP